MRLCIRGISSVGCGVDIQDLYNHLGEQRIGELVAAFYRRVKQDDLIGPMYPPYDWAGSEKRMRDFLVFRFGGPQRYLEERGHPRLKMRHMPFKIGLAERDRWLDLMGQAMQEVAIDAEAALVMAQLFAQVADFMRNKED